MVMAAQYREGQPLDDVREIAGRVMGSVVEVPEWGCLLVRIPDREHLSYLVVENRHWLTADVDNVLRTVSDREFPLAFREADAGQPLLTDPVCSREVAS